MKKSELFFTFLLVPLDLVMILLAFVLAYWLRAYQEVIYIWPFDEYFRFVITLLPAWIVIFALEGLYDIKNGARASTGLAKVFLGVSSGIMLLVAWLFLSRTFFFSRLVIIYAWVLAIILVVLGRFFIRTFQRFLYRYGIGVHRVIFIGSSQVTYNLFKEMQNNRSLGYRVIGVIDADEEKKKTTAKEIRSFIKVLGKLDHLREIIEKNPTDELILTQTNLSEKRMSELIRFCQDKNLIFQQTPNLFKMKTTNTEIYTLAGIPILKFRRTPLEGWGKIIKRLTDILGSAIGLIILSPLFLVVSIIIKLASAGPVFFRQQRMKDDGQSFTFLKFRSMYEGAEKEHSRLMREYGPVFKLKDDPRVTPFGRFIRRTSIDELPQLWNVLKGEMSLVGPRPPLPEEVKHYNHWQKGRLTIKPGITGLWQVSGRSDVNFDDWVRLDLYYIENWSLWLDLKILTKTVWIVLTRRGAY